MRLCQLEFYSQDVEASLKFAGEVLGWKRVPVAIEDQAVIAVDDASPYGISIRKSPKGPAGQLDLIAYFEVSIPLQVLRETCLALGGTILQEPIPCPGYGLVMIVGDCGGLRYGLYEARFEAPRPKVRPSQA